MKLEITMHEGQFVKVFDVLDSGYKDWQFSAFGLIFVFIGLIIFFAPRLIAATGIPDMDFKDFKSNISRAFRYFFLAFAVLWTSAAFLATFVSYERHRSLARDNTCKLVEGSVQNFFPMPYSGHAEESFTVSGVSFKYSDYVVTDAFNNTRSHGGPIDKDVYVRICYDPIGNQILRLEIRDFNGPIKDYAKATTSFSESSTQGSDGNLNLPSNKTAVTPLPWYNSLFIILYFVDIAATQKLYLPYIRTFFRVRSARTDNQLIPQTLGINVKSKLRNSVIYWDQASQTIWLLPRGFNRLRLMLMVARLSTDVTNKAITNSEICFSSGILVVLALFFWTAYQFFSQVMPTNGAGLSAGEFVGIAIALTIIGGFIRLRMDSARMELLVRDALSELQNT